jgi:phosphoribosylanthranilate isomerase
MSPLVKICGLSTPETLDAALAAGADMVGFVFFPKSPRNVSLEAARALGARVAGRAKTVALTVDATDAELAAIVDALRPDMIQLHGRETPERCGEIRARFGIPVMKALGVSTAADLISAPAYAAATDMLLFDAKPPKDAVLPGGNGLAFDWPILSGLDLGKPFMVSGGLDAENVGMALALTGAQGADVSSGVESSPGTKDPRRIEDFIAAARAAAREETR